MPNIYYIYIIYIILYIYIYILSRVPGKECLIGSIGALYGFCFLGGEPGRVKYFAAPTFQMAHRYSQQNRNASSSVELLVFFILFGGFLLEM